MLGLAHALHANLYGLPADPGPLPTALDALLQTTLAAKSGDERTAVLRQLAEQLRNAAEIIDHYRRTARIEGLPPVIADQLHRAHGHTEQIAHVLDGLSIMFGGKPTTRQLSTGPLPPQHAPDRGPTPQTPAAPPAARRR